MQWHRLDPDKTQIMIESIESGTGASLFTQKSSEAKCMRLPFYDQVLLYRITNNTCLPIFSMDFLGNGELFYYLDGSETPFSKAKEKAKLVLTEQNILAFLQFYYFNVVQEDGEIYPVFGVSPLPDLEDQNIHATKQTLPAGQNNIDIARDQVTHDFLVTCPLFYDGSLMKGIIAVTEDGDVSIQSLSPLLGSGNTDFASAAEKNI